MVPYAVLINSPFLKVLPELRTNIPFSDVLLSVSSYFRQVFIGENSSVISCELQFLFIISGLQINTHISISVINGVYIMAIGSFFDINFVLILLIYRELFHLSRSSGAPRAQVGLHQYRKYMIKDHGSAASCVPRVASGRAPRRYPTKRGPERVLQMQKSPNTGEHIE